MDKELKYKVRVLRVHSQRWKTSGQKYWR